MKIISVAAALFVVMGVVQAAPFPGLAKRNSIDINAKGNKALVKTNIDAKAKDVKTNIDAKAKDVKVLKRHGDDRHLLGVDVSKNKISVPTDANVGVHRVTVARN
ncbi:hypothetical protein BG006_007196 [Podila minutissima]|uniref:Uncharacterized protein n=1 Tax=Podila minutissima TaxID=64525 RepID=A0A9P5SK25_9FUNG|nr:hypothetical protein BG006_007196 [Podila minutissima]